MIHRIHRVAVYLAAILGGILVGFLIGWVLLRMMK